MGRPPGADGDLWSNLENERRILKKRCRAMLVNQRPDGFDADDLVQESLLAAWETEVRGGIIWSPRAYLKTIARRTLYRLAKRGNRTILRLDDEDSERVIDKLSEARFLESREVEFLKFQLRELHQTLSSKDQEILRMWCEGEPSCAIASKFDTTADAINTKLSKIRATLRRTIEGGQT